MRRAFELREDLSELLDKCLEIRNFEEGGCSILFLGFVKGKSKGKKVEKYRVYGKEELLDKLEEICEEAEKKFSLIGAYVFKKFGELFPGDLITAVLVLAKTREEGFKASSWIVDRIKEVEKGNVEERFSYGATGGI